VLAVRHCVLVAVGAVAALAGCGGSGRSGPSASHPRPAVRSAEHDARERAAYTEADGTPIAPEPQDVEPNKGTPGGQDATGGKIDVSIRHGRFSPRVMYVRVSQIVVFTDDDDVPHTVRAVDASLPHSGLIPVGGRFEFTALRPGRLRYRCIIHGIGGELVVRPRVGVLSAPPRRKPPCDRLLGSARHELGDTGSEAETHCVMRR
jgi:plastocyanin